MKITHISPEFNYNNVFGTLSMKEKKSFFGSKLIKYEEALSILNQSIVYYQQLNGEQTNINSEILLPPVLYNASDDKSNNSSLIQNKSNANGSWILTINYGNILQNFLFATLKNYRTFEGITNNITLNNDVNVALTSYIADNLINIYQLSKVDLFISYNNIANSNPPLLVNNNIFDESIAIEANLVTTYTSNLDTNKMIDTISFTQTQNNTKFNFNYYFNLYFSKI